MADATPSSFATPSDMIVTKQPILWHDPQANQLAMWAGLPFNWTLWPGAYKIDNVETGGFSFEDAQVPSDNDCRVVLNGLWGSSWCSSTETLYSLGGFITQNNSNTPVNVMVTHTYEANTWSNTTKGTVDSRFNVFAQVHFVPNFGDSGVLVLFVENGHRQTKATQARQACWLICRISMFSAWRIRNGTLNKLSATYPDQQHVSALLGFLHRATTHLRCGVSLFPSGT